MAAARGSARRHRRPGRPAGPRARPGVRRDDPRRGRALVRVDAGPVRPGRAHRVRRRALVAGGHPAVRGRSRSRRSAPRCCPTSVLSGCPTRRRLGRAVAGPKGVGARPRRPSPRAWPGWSAPRQRLAGERAVKRRRHRPGRGAGRRRRPGRRARRQPAHRRARHRQEPAPSRRSSRCAARSTRRSRWPRRPAGPPSGWRNWPATTRPPCTGCSAPGRPSQGATGSVFDHDAGNPIEAELVVVDEASMLDVELGAALISAIADGTHLVIVGDPAQLPSIGPGRVLGDLIDSGTVPVTELTKLYRQTEGGAIARLAIAVRAGDLVRRRRPDPRGGVVPGPRVGGGRAPGGAAGHRLDPPGVRLRGRPDPGRHPGAPRAGRHPGAEPGAEGRAEPGHRHRPRVRRRRPGGRHRQPPGRRADRLRQRRGRHRAVLRRQLAAGGVHRRRVGRSAARRWAICCTAGRSPCTGRRVRSGRRWSR